MEVPINAVGSLDATRAGEAFLRQAWSIPPNKLGDLVDLVGEVLGADSARLLVVDYGLLSLQGLDSDGAVGDSQPVEGTLAGRALSHSEVVVAGDDITRVFLPLTDGSERIGVLELTHGSWDESATVAAETVAHLLVLLLVSKRRYSDAVVRARRSRPLSPAAEIQWGLLPPLACSANGLALSGILEPAYSIGGDSFDYALDRTGVQFAIVDAVGHGMPAVLISVAVVNALRNARREGVPMIEAYDFAGAVLEAQFGEDAYATGQVGSLNVVTGELSFFNAGHPLPLLVRDGNVNEIPCGVSWPMGLGGEVVEVATVRLQPRDVVLFYTDGAIDSRSPDGAAFGLPRLSSMLAIAVQEGVTPAETVRRLSTSIVAHNDDGLTDDSTLLLLQYEGPPGN